MSFTTKPDLSGGINIFEGIMPFYLLMAYTNHSLVLIWAFQKIQLLIIIILIFMYSFVRLNIQSVSNTLQVLISVKAKSNYSLNLGKQLCKSYQKCSLLWISEILIIFMVVCYRYGSNSQVLLQLLLQLLQNICISLPVWTCYNKYFLWKLLFLFIFDR